MYHKAIFILLTALLFCSMNSSAQSEEADIPGVKKVMHNIFEGMRLGDSSMVSQVFYPGAEFFSAFVSKEGRSVLREGSIQEWLNAIGTPHEKVWNEEWWDPSIRVDGNFAHAWTPYAFYLDDTLSHCGVNSFHFIKDEDGNWKIFHATDTRHRAGCESFIPDHIKMKHRKGN